MLAGDLACQLDPVQFARRVGMVSLDPWQTQVLTSRSDRMILLCARQMGKSTVAAVMALHSAIYHPKGLVLLLSPSLRQSGELFRKVVGFYRTIAKDVPSEAESALRIEFPSGGRIVSLPGTEGTVRGYSAVDLLVVDEASRVEDELFQAVSPMLAVSGGRMVLLSTPFGKRGTFWRTWMEGGSEWMRVKVTATECPRISAAFLDRERASMPAWAHNQEFLCEFEDNELTSVFSYSDIERAAKDVEEWTLDVPDAKPIVRESVVEWQL